MTEWSLVTEVIALLLLEILLMNLAAYKTPATHSIRMYRNCLFISVGTVLCDMLCIVLLHGGFLVPKVVNIFTNSVYFWLTVIMSSSIALYIFEKMLEHVYDRYCIVRARVLLTILVIVYTMLVIINVPAGLLFWFDGKGAYHRGPLNTVGYGFVFIEMILVFICFARHRSSVSKEMKHALKTIPPLLAILVAIQLLNQGLLLNGIMAAVVDVILYVSFFSQRRESDSVTGVGNRDGFFSELALRIAGKQQFQVILAIPRDFGLINQRYGHQIGNEFLYSIAAWMEEHYKEAAAFRYIGVSFALVLPYSGREQAEKYVKELMDRFQEPWKIGPCEESITTVFSDLICMEDDLGENQVLEFLDYMLSLTKRSTQQYMHFDDALAEGFFRRRMVAQTVRGALREQLFEVWYQPVYAPGKKKYVSLEALVRLKDRNGCFISPAEFIPIAEEIGVVNEIFWLVIEEVFGFLKEHEDLDIETISINMSMEQFDNPQLCQSIEAIFKKWMISPEKIRFEITERMISEDAVKAKETVQQMADLGFWFYLDDFGIGYSNFATVSQFHFECIKLDRSLVDVMEEGPKGFDLVRGLIQLFHNMGM